MLFDERRLQLWVEQSRLLIDKAWASGLLPTEARDGLLNALGEAIHAALFVSDVCATLAYLHEQLQAAEKAS